jgi:signal transduction histidine kinase
MIMTDALIFVFGPYRLLPQRQLLLRGDAAVRIGGRALDLLTALVERPGELLSKADLIARAWPTTTVDESNLKVNMASLRRALKDDADAVRYIATVNGRGYRFIAPVEANIAPGTGRGGTMLCALDRPPGLAGVLDISERAHADLAHAARVSMLGELTVSIAHEVNQPLGAIATNGEAGLRWLARSEPDLDEVRELTGNIVADARRAAQIISRIRSMASRRTPEKALLCLHDVIEEALLFMRHEIQMRRVTATLDLAAALPPLIGDRTQLQQVIVNLTINAMQAMIHSEDGARTIVIGTSAPAADRLCCSVEDRGPGIAPNQFGRLFESFFSTKHSGMGMGLPICRSIIQAHGGVIEASNLPQGGARFSFILPAAHAAG